MAVPSSSSAGAKWRGPLVDDTMGPVDALSEATIRSELAEIAKFRTNRNKGYHWVTHQLKVLVSDEEEDADADTERYDGRDGDANRAYDSDDSADIERYGIKLSLQRDENQARSTRAETASHETVIQCRRCNKYPRFSQTRRTRHFRLVEPWEYLKPGDEHEACDHFVAVSYCWSSYENGSRTCQIRDCTGSRKDSLRVWSGSKGKSKDENVYLSPEDGRVPFDEVLDRAVEFASSEGLRCIWIDQACLPQDESEEHQIGVQSMDMVYKRARHTIGLLGCRIRSQVELDSLGTFFAWDRRRVSSGSVPGQDWWNLHLHRKSPNGVTWAMMRDEMPKADQRAVAKQVCRAMIDLLQRIIDDKWYTRAWILQESVSAGPKLSLLLQVPPALEYNPSSFMEQDGRLMTTNRHENSTFILTWSDFGSLEWGLYHMVLEFYDTNLFCPRDRGDSSDDIAMVSIVVFITSPKRIPRPHPRQKSHGIINCSCKPGFVCNAACAIGLLRGRHCLKAEDKIAIVANLCNFEIRLDTFQLAKHFKSLRLCLIALALLNADLSLLVPEFYEMSCIDDPVPLFQVPYMNLHKVNKEGVEADHVPRFQTVSQPCLTPGGVILPAILWCVDREIDFTPIKSHWADRWWAMKTVSQSGSSGRQMWWQDVGSLVGAQRQSAERILRNIRKGYLEGESLRNHKDDAFPGIIFSASVRFNLLERDAQAKYKIGDMVRDILSYLLHSKETELANSIWQSLRSPSYKAVGGRVILPDKIDYILLQKPDFGALLHFDYTPNGAFAQEWLFDRIVLKGKLWVGHYIPSRTKGSGISSMQPFSVISNDIYSDDHRFYRHLAPPPYVVSGHYSPEHTFKIVRFRTRNYDPDIKQTLDPWVGKPMSLDESSVIGRDIVKTALYEEVRHQLRDPASFKRLRSPTIPGSVASVFSPAQEAFVNYIQTYVGWDIAEQESCVRRRISAFDVDGPCEVATPFDGTRERIPHSYERTLSSCWVVEAKGTSVPDEEADWIRKEFVRFRRLILGGSLWPTESPDPSELELQHVPERLIEDVSPLRLEVLRQVHGVWDIIDPAPFQSYLFS